MFQRSLRLRAPEFVSRYIHFTQAVSFLANVRHLVFSVGSGTKFVSAPVLKTTYARFHGSSFVKHHRGMSRRFLEKNRSRLHQCTATHATEFHVGTSV